MKNTLPALNRFENISQFKHQLQALALADAIFSPEWEYRYFSFNAAWDKQNHEMMASFRNGEGDEYFILIAEQQVIAKIFAHHLPSPIDWKQIPNQFPSFKNEVAFDLNNSSYVFWGEHAPLRFSVIPQALDDYPFLNFIVQSVEQYWQWAQDYYEIDIDLDVLKQVFHTLKITQTQLSILNPELTLNDLQQDLIEILGT